MSCSIKVNSNTIGLTMHTSCYCVLDLLCVKCLLIELPHVKVNVRSVCPIFSSFFWLNDNVVNALLTFFRAIHAPCNVFLVYGSPNDQLLTANWQIS